MKEITTVQDQGRSQPRLASTGDGHDARSAGWNCLIVVGRSTRENSDVEILNTKQIDMTTPTWNICILISFGLDNGFRISSGVRMLQRLLQNFRCDLAVDLGTANTLVAIAGEGLVLDEPSVVAVDQSSGKILSGGAAVGHMARQMQGRTPQRISVVRPLAGGVVTDFVLCEAMLRYFLRKAQPPGWRLKPAGAGGRARQHYPRGKAGRLQQRAAGRGRPWCGSCPRPRPRPSAPACRSPNRWPAWSATSAAARPRWP